MTPEPNKVDPVIPSGRSPTAADVAVPGTSLGASLRGLREARGWSIGDVCARLKFAPRQIEALEADRWDALPQGPSLRGLVRNYARLLEVSPDTLMQALPAHLQSRPAPLAKVGGGDAGVAELPAGSTLPGVSGGPRGGGLGWLMVIVFLLAVIGLAAYLLFAWWLPRSQGLEAEVEVALPFALEMPADAPAAVSGAITAAPVPSPVSPEGAAPVTPSSRPDTAAAEVAASVAPPPANRAPATSLAPVSPTGPFVVPGLAPEAAPAPPPQPEPPAAPPNQLQLQVQSASWLEVRNADGSVALSATLQPGDTRELVVTPPARVVIGNANGVGVQWQGKPFDLAAHQRGNVARFTLE